MLHITNGDGAAELIRQAGVVRTIVPWRNALHEGPVPAENPATLREIRARFLVRDWWNELGDVLPWLEWRDHELEQVGDHDEVVLWFEHDLCDQLQLLQILDRLAGTGHGEPRLSLICIGSHSGIDRSSLPTTALASEGERPTSCG